MTPATPVQPTGDEAAPRECPFCSATLLWHDVPGWTHPERVNECVAEKVVVRTARQLAAWNRRATDATLTAAEAELDRLRALINTPEVDDWFAGVRIEAAHQVERWGVEHDAGKTAFDWFWLVGYLAQKAADAQIRGDADKAKHHTISTAAALLNWHAALTGRSNAMRPGIDAEARGIE